MKKLILICGLFCFPLLGICQSGRVPMEKSYYTKYYKPQKVYYFYIEIGMAIARGNFAKAPSLDKPLLDSFVGNDGMGGSNGILFSSGFKFPLTDVYSGKDRFYPTFNFGVEVTTSSINFRNINPEIGLTDPFAAIGLELGGGLSYNYQDKFVIESNFDLLFPLYVANPGISYYDSYNEEMYFKIAGDVNRDGISSVYHLGKTIGFGIRRNNLKVFLEWFNYKVEQYYEYSSYDEYGDKKSENFNADFDIKTLRTGLSFAF